MNKSRAPIRHLPRLQPNIPGAISWPFDRESAHATASEGTSHLHWTIQAYHHQDDNGSLQDVVLVQVSDAPDEPSAIARAMLLIERANYRVASVLEVCSKDPALKE